MRLIFTISALFAVCHSLNILVYSPQFAHSHTNFMGKIADVLHEAGHKVIVLQPIFNARLTDTGTKHCEVIKFDRDESLSQLFDELFENSVKSRWQSTNLDPSQIFKSVSRMRIASEIMCKRLISDQKLMDTLAAHKFDIAFTEVYESCGLGLFHLLNVQYNTAFSTSIGAAVSSWIGAPNALSYVPSMASPFTDRMTFFERLQNSMTIFVEELLMRGFVRSAQGAFDHIEGFPDMKDLVANSTFFFTNNDPLIEFPRPTVHRIVDVGGIAVSPKKNSTLNEKWSTILSIRPQNVLISFGSMSKSVDMPSEYKVAIVKAARRFPEVTFIWKYENESDTSVLDGAENVLLSKWVPQTDLLSDSRLTAFVTHGGMGSVNELISSGKKAIVVPLFGDQFHNAKILERMNSVIVYDKFDLENETKLYDVINELLSSEKLTLTAQRLSEMIASRPFSARDQLVKYTEFSAKFGPLPQLVPYGTQLNFVQYFLLDVIAFVLFVTLSTVSLVVFLLRRLYLRWTTAKLKNE